MAALIWSEKSLADVEDIYEYIAADSPLYARHQVEKIITSVERLSEFPQSGRNLPEFPLLHYREVIVDPYRVIYRHDADNDRVTIVSVVHGRRLLKENSFT